MPTTDIKRSFNNLFFHLLVVFASTILTLAVLDHYFHHSGLRKIVLALQNLYRPNQNIVLAPYLAGVNFYTFFYIVLLLSIAFLGLIHIMRRQRKRGNTLEPLYTTISLLIFILFPVVSALQTISLAYDAKKEFKIFAGKTMEQKYSAIAGPKIYSFIRYSKERLPGFHNTQFLTDMNLEKDPGMIIYRILAYFLYPIDIRNVRGGASDSLIIFAKDHAAASVPENFRVLGTFDQHTLIAVPK